MSYRSSALVAGVWSEISGVFSLLCLANLCVCFFCVNWDCTALSSLLTPLLILNVGAESYSSYWEGWDIWVIGSWDSVLCLEYLPALGLVWKCFCMAVIFSVYPKCTNILYVWNSTILRNIFYIAILSAVFKSFIIVFVVFFESRETVSNIYCNTSLHLDPWLDWKHCRTDLTEAGQERKTMWNICWLITVVVAIH